MFQMKNYYSEQVLFTAKKVQSKKCNLLLLLNERVHLLGVLVITTLIHIKHA